MASRFEVLLTNDASGQLWNTCLWDPNTGSTLATFKVRFIPVSAQRSALFYVRRVTKKYFGLNGIPVPSFQPELP